MTRALIFIPAADPDERRWMVVLWRYCLRRHYSPEAVVHQWCDVRRLMLEGVAQKVVVAVREHVDWLEVVSEQAVPPAPTVDSLRPTWEDPR